MHRISNQLIAAPNPAPALPLLPPLSRQKRDTAAPLEEEATTRAGGDRALAAQYAMALNLAGRRIKVDDFDYIPAHSTFGQWWRHLHDTFQSPDVQQWIRAEGIDTSTIKIDPA
jgi:hypothetical protein